MELKEVKVEQVILNRSVKRAIRLDAWALDRENRQFNMEMQNSVTGDNVRKLLPGSSWKNIGVKLERLIV